MTEGSITKHLVNFAIPLLIGNLFQQLYNTADALIVGNMLGNDALASVSATGNLVFLIISLFAGIAAGAGVLISRYFGAREEENLELAIHNNIAFGICTALILTVFGRMATPWMLRTMDTPEDVIDGAIIYTRVFFTGSIGMVMYNTLRSIMQAMGDSKRPLMYLVISSVTNIVLDIVFIGVFRTGVEGAAYATIISQFISAVLCWLRLLKSGLVEVRKIGFERRMLERTIRYGLPTGLQNSVIGFANVVVQSYVNGFGKMAVAGLGAYSKLEGFAFLPITAFSIALTTFIGQNLGAKQYDRAKKGAAIGVGLGLGMSELIGLLFMLTGAYMLRAFTAEPEAIAFGVGRMHRVSLFYFLLASCHCFSAVLRGAGKAVVPMGSMLVFWCVIRVSLLKVFVPYFNSIAVVDYVYPITWGLNAVFLLIYFLKADWVHAFVKSERA